MPSQDKYTLCLRTLFSRGRFGIKLGTETIQAILEGLGNPQTKLHCVHVAGTNGKGSICSSLASILHTAGYRVGLFTSPHLIHFNERISIDMEPISDDDVVNAYEAVQKVSDGEREATFFEYCTAMALYEFARRKVDWAVLETGMGGRLDATNIVSPKLTVITNISLEHQAYLGNTLAEIAFEKAGIIKENVPLVTGVKQKSAIHVIEEIARKKNAPVYRLNEDFKIRRNRVKGEFSYYGIDATWRDLKTPLVGRHQGENAALTLASCELLKRTGTQLTDEHIRDGLFHTKWPGRLEIVSKSPLVLLDGAHNLMAARNLANHLVKEMAGRKITMVIGILDDKPYKKMLEALLPPCGRVILTKPKINRALDPTTLLPIARKLVSDTTIIEDVQEAMAHAMETAEAQEVICAAGSLYVVGEARAGFLNQKPQTI